MMLIDGDLTGAVIGAAFEVHKTLGYGFLEGVYKRSMAVELIARGFSARIEPEIDVSYKGVNVGHYKADLLVENRVIVEVKAHAEYRKADEAQLLNELKATGLKVGMLVNFGRTKVEFQRMVM